jgi:hypothetical protein
VNFRVEALHILVTPNALTYLSILQRLRRARKFENGDVPHDELYHDISEAVRRMTGEEVDPRMFRGPSPRTRYRRLDQPKHTHFVRTTTGLGLAPISFPNGPHASPKDGPSMVGPSVVSQLGEPRKVAPT